MDYYPSIFLNVSLIFFLLNKISLLKVSFFLRLLKLFSFFLLFFDYFLNLFTLVYIFRVEIFNFLLLFKFHFQFLFLHSFFMSQFFSEVMPFKFRQIFKIPNILGIKVMFFLYHFLTIKGQSS